MSCFTFQPAFKWSKRKEGGKLEKGENPSIFGREFFCYILENVLWVACKKSAEYFNLPTLVFVFGDTGKEISSGKISVEGAKSVK